MSSEMSPSPSALASPPPLINSELGDLPPLCTLKIKDFSGNPLYPPPLSREGEGLLKRGASPLLNTPLFLTGGGIATKGRGQG